MRLVSRITSAWRFGLILPALVLAGCANLAPGSPGVEAHFETLKTTPARLTPFLRAMPKGADLHSHLSGAIYAESYIAWAGADGLCLVLQSKAFAEPPCDAAAGRPPAAQALADTAAYNAQVDALSMRNFEKGDVSGHNQFFATFARFDTAAKRRGPDMLAEAMNRAAGQNILYLELMSSPGMSAARGIGQQLGWMDDADRFLQALRERDLDGIATRAAADTAALLASARERMACASSAPQPGCKVAVRFLAQVVRTMPREQVFAQVALGFVLAAKGPDFVGINLVAPEDDRISLADYSTHMRLIGALRKHFPGVGISLHAGELAPGLVPPKELRFHIAEAVRVAGASRIGHGVDILHEDGAEALLAEMAGKGVLVEVNLTSNDVILGVSGSQHPFQTYRAFGVPMALSTDDEGVSRIDLTHEYQRAVQTYGLSYADLKTMSRNSLSHAFVQGASLWQDARRSVPVAACAADVPVAASPSPGCADFLRGSAKARLQWALERDYLRFEQAFRR